MAACARVAGRGYGRGVDVAVARAGGAWALARIVDGRESAIEAVADLPTAIAALEHERPRWVWHDTRAVLPEVLAAGVTVERARDLRLAHRILADAGRLARDERWATSAPVADDALFSLERGPASIDEVLAQHAAQEAAIGDDRSLGLLVSAESTGALVAAELLHVGLPWSVEAHDRLLTEALGPRPRAGRPARLEELATRIREALGVAVNPDSPVDTLRALRSQGLDVRSTSRWELADLEHPAIAPLLEYKHLARLWTANGWAWADQWVRDGRFHAEYVPGGVVTGRWATTGAGAMQIAKQIRGAIRADDGWRLVVADAAQLEPRVLAAMARDESLARAARRDLYDGLVAEGVAATRPGAKVAMLGALYGSTTGEAGRLVPALRRAYPRAMAVVDGAAAAGERGERVRTWLGRTSPLPGAVPSDATPRDAVSRERARGRFTRNFVVQGSAAEWALCWMALLRRSLRAASGELVYFLHDEVIVHAPQERADEIVVEIERAAAGAGRMLFGEFPVTFPVDARVVPDYGAAMDGA